MSIIWLVLYYSSYFISPNSLALTILRQLFDILFYFITPIVICLFYFTLAIFPTTIFRLLLYGILRILFYSYYSILQYSTYIILLQYIFHLSYFPSIIIFLLFTSTILLLLLTEHLLYNFYYSSYFTSLLKLFFI